MTDEEKRTMLAGMAMQGILSSLDHALVYLDSEEMAQITDKAVTIAETLIDILENT